MRKTADKILAIAFILFLGGMMLANILTPDRVFSLRENRYLAKRPELKLSSILSGRYTRQFEDYITDEFVLRDQWVLLKSDLERMLLRRENNGIFFASGGYLLEDFRQPGSALDRNIRQINRFAQARDIPVHVLLAPNSVALYPDKLPPFARVYDQLQVINQIKGELDQSVQFVPVFEALNRYRDEYLYFRTDHHWTMRGAYYAYAELAEQMGLIPLGLEDFSIETAAEGFWGTYFSKANNRYLNSDYIEVLKPRNPVSVQVSFNDREGAYSSLFFPEHLLTRDKYSYFLDGNHPLTVISSDADSTSKLVVFKDSFAHALLPFLAQHYQEIHVIDLRFFTQDISRYLLEHEIDEALFLFSVSGFSSDNSLVNFR